MLSDGKVVEFDAPGVLLANDDSYFASLVEQTGAAEAKHLRTLANASKSSTMRRRELNTAKKETDLHMSSSKLA